MACFPPLRLVPRGALLTIAAAVALGFGAPSCAKDSEKSEASTLVRLVTELRMADNAHKRAPLDRLRSMPCSAPRVCQARDACARAFEHHVRGVELGARIRNLLASSDAGPPPPNQDPEALLLEMNLEVEEGRKLMPDCEERVASLRSRHRL